MAGCLGRVLVGGKDCGAGFALGPRLVVTANHVTRNRNNESVVYVPAGGEAVGVECVQRDAAHDAAILWLMNEVEFLPTSAAVRGAGWRVESPPSNGNDPQLHGTVTTARMTIKNAQDHQFEVVQLQVDEQLGDFAGYSGSAVLDAWGRAVVALLVEQKPLRTPVVLGKRPPASNVLYAVPIGDVVTANDLSVRASTSKDPAPMRAQSQGPGQLIRELDPLDLEVHPAIEAVATTQELDVLPSYITRVHDEQLRNVVADAVAGHSRIVVLVGGSSTGKTRACWEAIQSLPADWRLWHPIDPGRSEAASHDLARIATKTVLWLNETHHYLLTPDSNLGERIAAGLREILRTPDRGPVLILGTMWPEYWATLTCPPTPASSDDPHAQARALLTGNGMSIPDAFNGDALDAFRTAAEHDPRLAEANVHAVDGELTQYLAGVPVLVERYRNAPAPARALIHAAMDARRLGHGLRLPAALLKMATFGYLTSYQWDSLGETWFDEAIAYTAAPCRGVRGPLAPRRPQPDEPMSSGLELRLADYLEQLGRLTRRTVFAPASLWDSLVAHGSREDLSRLASEARRRGLLRYAFQLFVALSEAGDSRALTWTAGLLREAGRIDEAIIWYQRAIEAGSTVAIAQAAESLRQAGRIDEAIIWYQRAIEAGGTVDTSRLAATLGAAGRIDEAVTWYRRADKVGSFYAIGDAVALLVEAGRINDAVKLQQSKSGADSSRNRSEVAHLMEKAGRIDEAITLYKRIAYKGLGYEALQVAHLLVKTKRIDEAIMWLQRFLTNRRVHANLRRMAWGFGGSGHYILPALQEYTAQLLQKEGRTDEAITWYQRAAESGSISGMGLATNLLRSVGRTNEAITWLEDLVTTGRTSRADYAWERSRGMSQPRSDETMTKLAELLQEKGCIDKAITWYRRAAESGGISAMGKATELLQAAGRTNEAITWLQHHAADFQAGRIELSSLEASRGAAVRRAAELMREEGRTDDAIAWLENYATAGFVVAMEDTADILQGLGHLDEAASWYERAARAGDNAAIARARRMFAQAHRVYEAIRWCQYIAENPGNQVAKTEASRTAGELLQEMGHIDEALIWYQRAATAGDLDALGEAARMLEEAGRTDEAVIWYRRAAGQGDEFGRWQAAKLLHQAGRLDRVVAQLQKQISTGDIEAAPILISVLEDAGRTDDALIWHQRAAGADYAFSMVQVTKMLHDAGRTEDANRLRRYGMRTDGEISDVWYGSANMGQNER